MESSSNGFTSSGLPVNNRIRVPAFIICRWKYNIPKSVSHPITVYEPRVPEPPVRMISIDYPLVTYVLYLSLVPGMRIGDLLKNCKMFYSLT